MVTLLFACAILLIACCWCSNSSGIRARPGTSSAGRFYPYRTWDPVAGQFGALTFIYGTLITSAVALVLSIPVGLGAAIFLSELAPPRLSDGLTFIIELLAAVPSVIYRLLAVFALVRFAAIPSNHSWAVHLGSFLFFRDHRTASAYGRRHHPGHHGGAIHHLDFAGIAAGCPYRPAGSGIGLGSHTLGVDLARSRSVCTSRHYRFHISGAGKGSGRNHGRYHGYRQHAADRGVPLRSRLYHAGRHCQRFTEATSDIHLSALIELGLVLFLLTIVINGFARLMVLATTRRGTAHP
jgi:phosphate transport system permease protein